MDSPEFRSYIEQVVENCQELGEQLQKRGHTLITGGSENHMLLIDVRPFSLTGSKIQLACDAVGITLNKNTVVRDKSALTPGGLRVGTCAVTTRGYAKQDMG